jgi:hypothetical protein
MLIQQLWLHWAFKRISHTTARSRSTDMSTWQIAQSCNFHRLTSKTAAYASQLVDLQHLRNKDCDWYQDYIALHAARSSSIEIVDWLRQHGIRIDADMLAAAVHAGQIDLCKHLRSIGCAWDAGACIEAAAGDRLGTLRWLRDRGCSWDVKLTCVRACSAA